LNHLYLEKDKPIEDFSKVIELAEALNAWANEHDIDGKQKERREEAVEIILWCKLTNSKSLDLSGLKLTSLPDQIFDLIQLESLYLADNQLTSISNKVSNLGNLKELDLEKNPIESLPEVLFGKIPITIDLKLSKEASTNLNKALERKLLIKEFAQTCPTTEEIDNFLNKPNQPNSQPSTEVQAFKAEPLKDSSKEIGK
jgi:Leucine-rich repeat (LRR) protein